MTVEKCSTCKHAFTTGKDRLYCKKLLSDKDDCEEYEMTNEEAIESQKIDKVYVVTSGEYSDYGISAVFIDKESAEMYCATKNTRQNLWDEYRIEEYSVGIVEGSKDYKKLVRARINKTNGNIEISWLWSYENMIPEVHLNLYHTEYLVDFTANRDDTEAEIEKIARDILAKWKYDRLF